MSNLRLSFPPLLQWILRAAPFFAAPLVLPYPFELLSFEIALNIYVIYFMLFFSWWVVRKSVTWRIETKETSDKKSSIHLPLFIVGVGVSLFLIHAMRLRLADVTFYWLLITLSLPAISDRLLQSSNIRLSVIAFWLYSFMLTYLSFMLWIWQPLWQALFVAFAIANICTLELMATIHLGNYNVPISKDAKRRVTKDLKKISPFALLITPFAIGMLTYLNQLPMHYLLIFVLIPLSIPMISDFRMAEDSSKLAKKLLLDLRAWSVLFLILLAILRLL